MQIDVKPSERIVLMGMTGSGKTEWAKMFLRRMSLRMPVVIIDPAEFWLGEYPVWASRKEPGSVDKPHLVRGYNPEYWVQCLQPDMYTKILEKSLLAVLKQKLVYVYIDENDGLATAIQVPLGLRKIWKTGRKFNVGACTGSQTYSSIPRIFKSQANHRILFKVGEEDAKDAAKLVHVTEEEVKELAPYEYFYYHVSMDRGIWMPPIDMEKEKKFIQSLGKKSHAA